ncbi:MAG TPA: hypothetical protein VGX37_06650 [Allosphingosinicella sp.]|jgi:hypothetical protein|nr:hypothetical protein [Allosphingosinicella sp.]
MRSWPAKALLLGGAASLLIAIPAFSQESAPPPESLLPPGFGDPQNLPPPEEKAPPAPRREPSVQRTQRSPAAQESPNPEEEELDALDRPRPLNYFTIPEGEARPIDVVGLLEPGNHGFAPDSFGRSNGAFLATLMQRLDAPLPSRWTSILLRRALLSRLAAPPAIHPVDWVAARADLLLRMGEADAARMLVQSVDQEFYTPRMIEVAAQTALATADPAALCPLVGPSRSREPVWKLAEGMCAALEGEPSRATALVDEARRQGGLGGVDILLAEKVIGAGTQARRAATIRWEEVDALSPWRFGLASATGAEIPQRLVSGASLPIQAWLARAPMVPLDQRLRAASVAASLGVFSSHSLVEIYSLIVDQNDESEQDGTVGARLHTAWADRNPGRRLEAMRTIWREGEGPHERHARLILTAGAAAGIPPSEEAKDDAGNLIASMLTAGLDRQAARWSAIVEDSGDQRAWALLALAAPRPSVDLSAGRVESYIGDAGNDGRRRAQMLVAGLAGLGRITEDDVAGLASRLDLRFGGDDPWSAAIDKAARDREPATVALLAAVGMQSPDWSGVSPDYLFRTVRALRSVGMDYEARMIAAEAVARL